MSLLPSCSPISIRLMNIIISVYKVNKFLWMKRGWVGDGEGVGDGKGRGGERRGGEGRGTGISFVRDLWLFGYS